MADRNQDDIQNDLQLDSHGIPRPVLTMKQMYEAMPFCRDERDINFVRQGKYLAYFTDDYDCKRSFACTYPTYQELPYDVLRGYFSFRTKWRRHQAVTGTRVYWTLLFAELANQIGTKDPMDGFAQMWHAAAMVAKQDNRFAQQCVQWLWDDAIYYGISTKQTAMLADRMLAKQRLFKKITNPDDAAALEAMQKLAGYQIPDDLSTPERENMMTAGMRAMQAKYPALFGAVQEGSLHLFAGLPFVSVIQQDRDVQVDAYTAYHCRNGLWYGPYYVYSSAMQHKAKKLLQQCEIEVRHLQHLSCRRKDVCPDDRHEIVQAMQEYLCKAHAIRIDQKHLEQIRKDATVTREALLTEEEKAAELEEKTRPSESNLTEQTEPLLTNSEKNILQDLLQKKNITLPEGVMPSVLVDQINAKLMDEIGDLVLYEEDGTIKLVEDYRDDLREILQNTK